MENYSFKEEQTSVGFSVLTGMAGPPLGTASDPGH